jgi:predicted PurR-regulated permease PerM
LTDQKPYTLDRIVRILISVAIISGLIWLTRYLSDVLIPFAVALLLAYLINPLIVLVQKKIPNRVGAVFLSLAGLIAVAILLGWLVIPAVADEIVQMGKLVSDFATNANLTEKASRWLPADFLLQVKRILTSPDMKEFFKDLNIWKILEAVARKVLPGVWGLISGTASLLAGLIGLAVIGLYFIFLLLDYDTVRGWKDLLPPNYRDPVAEFVDDFESAMSNYFRGQAAVAFICGLLFAFGFFLIGLPLSILLGLFIGLLNMIPYLQVLGLVPAGMLALMHAVESDTNVWVILSLTGLVFVVVQIIQDTLLVPKIMGKVTGLNPAIMLLSLSIWGKLLGLLGMIIALPLTYLLLVYYRRLIAPRSATVSDGKPIK